MRLRVVLLLLFAACRREASAIDEVMRGVSSELRPKARVQVIVKASAEEPTAADLALRKSIEDRIEQENIGRLVSSGAGRGFIDVTVEVENTAEAISRLRKVLQSLDVLPKSSFRVSAPRASFSPRGGARDTHRGVSVAVIDW